MGEEFKEKAKSFDFKKYLPVIGIVVAIVVVIAILVSIFGGGPKKAVKKYIKAMNKQDAAKIIKCIDPAGKSAWSYTYFDDFDEEDYEEFLSDYEDLDEDDIDDYMKEAEDSLDDMFDEINDEYDSYKLKIEEFKDVEEIAKDLYEVKAKISIKAEPVDDDDDEIDESDVLTFIVYKNKIIYSTI